jgi:hypothetical protein
MLPTFDPSAPSECRILERIAGDQQTVQTLLDAVFPEEVREDVFVVDYDREIRYLLHEGKMHATILPSHFRN